MSSYIEQYIRDASPVILAISGSTVHGVIKGSDGGFLLVEVDSQGPRLLNLALVEQIIPKQ
ncbi:MAG: hypothetical protein R3F46_01610 [bacterium]|nr:hypothetical protein [bacterium]